MSNEVNVEKSVERKPYYGGSQKCTDENMDYFIIKLKQLNDRRTTMTFRQWIFNMIHLFDLID